MLPEGMTDMDVEVLRILNGEDLPNWGWGAAMAACCSYLKGEGYAQGLYEISPKGKQLLKDLGYAS
jgi:hypothetical protein